MGANEESVRRAGINVPRLKLQVYAFAGVTVGLAAIVLASRINSAHPGIGLGYELDAIAASVIGGASLMGGRGTVLGAISGALVMATIRFSLNLFGMEPFLQQIVVGIVADRLPCTSTPSESRKRSVVRRRPASTEHCLLGQDRHGDEGQKRLKAFQRARLCLTALAVWLLANSAPLLAQDRL